MPGISDELWEETYGVREAAANAYAYIWGVLREKNTYAPTINEKWRKERLENYFKDYCRKVRRFDEDLEIYLTKEDKKAIDAIIRKRLEQLITGQAELEV